MYSLSITVSNLHAMYQPVASIPLSGTVPTKVTGIALRLLSSNGELLIVQLYNIWSWSSGRC